MATQHIPFEYHTAFGEADEKERLAQYLLALAAKQQPEAGRMVGNIYVPTHPLRHLANALKMAQGNQLMREAARTRREAYERLAGDQAREFERIAALLSGQMPQPAAPAAGPAQETPFPPVEAPFPPASAPSPSLVEAVRLAGMSRFPAVQKFGEQLRQQLASQFSAMAPHATPESVIASRGDPTRLQPRPEDRWGDIRNLAPPGAPPIFGTTEQRTGKPVFAPQPAANVSVSLGDKLEYNLAEKDYEQLFGKERAQQVRDIQKTLSTAGTAYSLVKTTPINWGILSDVKTFAQKLGREFGREVPQSASATELYNSFIVPLIREFIKPLGAGTGVSDKDREFAERALALATREPRMAEFALLFAMRGALKELQQYENEIRNAAAVAPSSARKFFESKIPRYGVTFPRGVRLPDNIFSPGVLEEMFAQAAPAAASPPVKLSPDAERVIRQYLPR